MTEIVTRKDGWKATKDPAIAEEMINKGYDVICYEQPDLRCTPGFTTTMWKWKED